MDDTRPNDFSESWENSLNMEEIDMYSTMKNKSSSTNPYKYNSSLNKKFFLYCNDLVCIRADCVVIQTAKNVFSTKGDRDIILKACGEKILDDLQNFDGVLTLSNSFVTKCYNLKYKYVIHTMLPKFSNSYKIACESSLHQAVRNILDTLISIEMKSVCLGNDIFQPSKNFPIITAITIILRTLRRCMEKLLNKVDRIILCVNNVDTYQKLKENMKIFFPRSLEEEIFMSKYVPIVKETEYGDILIPERNIDILSNFKQKNENKEKKREIIFEDNSEYIHNYEIYRNDDQRIFNTHCKTSDFVKNFYHQNSKKYTVENYKELEQLKFIFYKGKDTLNRKIFIIDLKRLDFNELKIKDHIDLLILFLIKYFQGFYNVHANVERYAFLLSLNETTNSNHPSIYFIRTLIKVLNCYTSINWDNIDIGFVEPNLMFKLYLWFVRVYLPIEIWNRILYFNNFNDLIKEYDISKDDVNFKG